MTMHDDHRPGSEAPAAPSATGRPIRRRARAIAGVAGLAAVLGTGAYLTTGQLLRPEAQPGNGTRTVTTVVPAATTPSSAAARHQKTGDDVTTGKAAEAAPEPSLPQSAAERVAAARKAAAKDGVKITRPLPEMNDPVRMAAAAAAKEVTVGSAKEGGTMRIVTAHDDLTGQRELAWVAGGVKKYGEVSCSQKFKFYNEAQPKVRDSLLVCSRTSRERSVITVDTKIGGRPPVGKSLAVIAREWRKLG